jgi:hypothetical protein
MTYTRTSKSWHRLDIHIDGRRCTFFGFTKAEVFGKAAARIRSQADHRRLVSIEEHSNAVDFEASRARA